MAKACGILFLLQVEDTAGSDTWTSIASLRDTSLSINNEQVDITDKGSASKRVLLACGINSMSISGSGLFDTDATLAIVHAKALDGSLYNYKLISDLGDSYEGAFQVASLERTGSYNGAEEYSISLESSGVIAYA